MTENDVAYELRRLARAVTEVDVTKASCLTDAVTAVAEAILELAAAVRETGLRRPH